MSYLGNEVEFDVVDLEVTPCDDQSGGDVIDAASKVRFTVVKATVRYSPARDVARLAVQAKVGPLGTDGDGKYANKHLFGEMVVWFDTTTKTSEWWTKRSRFDFKQFLTAMGLDPKNPPRLNDAFLTSLQEKDVIADIRKVEMQQKDSDGTYKGTGEFKNELKNYRKAE